MSDMTIGDWSRGPFRMRWSIYNRGDYAAFEAAEKPDDDHWREAYDRIRLNLKVPEPVPDGVYPVIHQSGWSGFPAYGEADGVVVKDGKFVPVPTDEAAFRAVCRSFNIDPAEHPNTGSYKSPIDHVFIEHWLWCEENQMFEVTCGS